MRITKLIVAAMALATGNGASAAVVALGQPLGITLGFSLGTALGPVALGAFLPVAGGGLLAVATLSLLVGILIVRRKRNP
ncbi:MAG: hypothetical protein ABI900_11545 [Betaproteobacteria bacterium]